MTHETIYEDCYPNHQIIGVYDTDQEKFTKATMRFWQDAKDKDKGLDSDIDYPLGVEMVDRMNDDENFIEKAIREMSFEVCDDKRD